MRIVYKWYYIDNIN